MLSGLVCVVTGAGQGIGRAVAERFAREGGKVVVADRRSDTGRATADAIVSAGGEAVFVETDVTIEDSVSQMAAIAEEQFGRIDVLVNNAGGNVFLDPLEATEAEWDHCFDLNVKSAWLCTKHVGRVMRANGGGSVVNVASIHAFQTSAGSFPYAAAKAGVVGLTRVLALDLARYRIRVNALCPGWTVTAPVQGWLREQPDQAAAFERIEARHPIGRLGAPDDMASAALYLASSQSSFMTASTLLVDGGLLAHFD